MQFLSPNMLWALLAVSIPLIVHLFNFRRTKKVYFSQVNLLKTVETESSSFRKLLHRLILLSRILCVAFLALAFAQPVWNTLKANAISSNVGTKGIYIDNSMSMQNQTDNKSYLDLAVLKVEELLTIFTRTNKSFLLNNDFDPKDQNIQTGFKLKDRLTSIKYSEQTRTLDQVLNKLRSTAYKNVNTEDNSYFLFSDFQKSTLGDLDKIKFKPNEKVNLIPIGGTQAPNVFVDSVWLAMPIVKEMQYNTLWAKIKNTGDKKANKVPIKLNLDGMPASTASVSLEANASAEVSFKFNVKGKGMHKGSIELNDQPVVFDNQYYFVLNASPSVSVMHLFEQKSNYFPKLYSNDSLFSFKSYSASAFDPELIKQSNLLILEGLSEISSGLSSNILEFLKQGGHVCIVPGTKMSISSYSNLLGVVGITGVKEMPMSGNFIEITEPNKTSPFFEDVFEKGSFNGLSSLPKTTKTFAWQGPGEKLLSLKSGEVFLSRTKVNTGQLYLLGAPLDPKLNGLGEHAYFVPTFLKMATMSAKIDKISHSFTEENIAIFMTDSPKNAVYKLKNGKNELIPNQRILSNTLFLNMPKASDLEDLGSMNSGFYDLKLENKTIRTLALNYAAKESDIKRYTPAELKDIFKGNTQVSVYESVFDTGYEKELVSNNEGKPLWKYCIILALLALLAEILLIRYFKPKIAKS